MAVPTSEVEAIMRITACESTVECWRSWDVGQRVRIVSGPLSGLEGTLVTVRNGIKLVVEVTILRRAVAVEINPADIEVCSTQASRPCTPCVHYTAAVRPSPLAHL